MGSCLNNRLYHILCIERYSLQVDPIIQGDHILKVFGSVTELMNTG